MRAPSQLASAGADVGDAVLLVLHVFAHLPRVDSVQESRGLTLVFQNYRGKRCSVRSCLTESHLMVVRFLQSIFLTLASLF